MLKEILIGSGNRHKAEEISRLLSDLPLKVKTLSDFPAIVEPEETGETLEENAVLKARYYSEVTGLLTLADDTGLEVDALNGAPGVFSARYAGEGCSYEDNNRKLLKELNGVPQAKRGARFRTVMALCDARGGFLKTAEGEILGQIRESLQGAHGFGYDPVFYLPEVKKTLAEIPIDEKNKVSHRAQALAKAKEILKDLLKRD